MTDTEVYDGAALNYMNPTNKVNFPSSKMESEGITKVTIDLFI